MPIIHGMESFLPVSSLVLQTPAGEQGGGEIVDSGNRSLLSYSLGGLTHMILLL
jgi:hypothetical protein